jgi:hypothetical protein
MISIYFKLNDTGFTYYLIYISLIYNKNIMGDIKFDDIGFTYYLICILLICNKNIMSEIKFNISLIVLDKLTFHRKFIIDPIIILKYTQEISNGFDYIYY